MEKNNWVNALTNAISEFESRASENDILRLMSMNASNAWSEENEELFRRAAGVIVEPYSYCNIDDDKSEMDWYFNRCEKEGFDFIKSIELGHSSELWNHIINLVSETGY